MSDSALSVTSLVDRSALQTASRTFPLLLPALSVRYRISLFQGARTKPPGRSKLQQCRVLASES
eukprot:6190157-Pleurochrysis_carterae.AAC.2